MKSSASKSGSKKSKKRRTLIILGSLLVLLIAFRLYLPIWVLKFINRELAQTSGYFGHVEDIDICLYRGAYQVDGLYINKVDTATQKQTPLFNAPLIDISIEWIALFHGKIVTELEILNPVLRFTEDAAEPEQMEKDTNDFRKMLKAFTPTSVNRFEIIGGTIGYQDPHASPKVDIEMTDTHILARNLSNVRDTSALPAKVTATANVYGGNVAFNMHLDALAEDPTYDMNVEVKNAQLKRLNDFFQAYGNFDVSEGTFGMYMEMAAKDKKFIGYVKPFIKDLKVVSKEDKRDNLLRKIWEALVGIAGDILEAPKTDVVATKVPIVGEYDRRTIGIWYAIFAALRNGFYQALVPSIDNQINIKTVNEVSEREVKKQGFFKKIFGKPGDEKKREKSSKER
ncbi:MAG TPA: DUF748 domain-containing protein [Saprospiraceae bacterium]|nr:DUF748 domain-containing protein [Saprospiraceae bacterium]